MKDLNKLICGFSVEFGFFAAGTALLIGFTVNKENSDLKVAVVAACVLAVMSGVILAILLLMKKQILPEEVHNENKLHELLTRMVVDSSIEENCKKERDKLRNEINSNIKKAREELETNFKTILNEHNRKIEEELAQKSNK